MPMTILRLGSGRLYPVVAQVVFAEADHREARVLCGDAEFDDLAVARGGGRTHAAGRIGEGVAQKQQAQLHQGSRRGFARASPPLRACAGLGLAAKKRQISCAALMSWLVEPSSRGTSSSGCGALWPPFRIA